MRKLLGASTEQLAKDTFLDICVLPDGRCEGVNKFFVELWVLTEILEVLHLSIIKQMLMIILQKLVLHSSLIVLIVDIFHFLILVILLLLHVNIEAAFISPHEVDHINVCAIDIFENSHLRVHSDTHSLVYTNGLDSVARLDKVDEILIDTQVHGVRCLALRHGLRCLLHFHVLLVREVAAVVNHLELVATLAVVAEVRLENTTARDKLLLGEATLAAEVGFFHLRDDV